MQAVNHAPCALATAYWSRVDADFFAATKEDAARAASTIALSTPRLLVHRRPVPFRLETVWAQGQQPLQLWMTSQSKVPY